MYNVSSFKKKHLQMTLLLQLCSFVHSAPLKRLWRINCRWEFHMWVKRNTVCKAPIFYSHSELNQSGQSRHSVVLFSSELCFMMSIPSIFFHNVCDEQASSSTLSLPQSIIVPLHFYIHRQVHFCHNSCPISNVQFFPISTAPTEVSHPLMGFP